MKYQTKTGLILTGGGARAAYQVGVLQAVSAILTDAGWPPRKNPFDIVCGTSAGAINATAFACRADDFGESVQTLFQVWQDIEVGQVYRADSLGVLRSGAQWLSLLSFGWMLRKWRTNPPNALLDNTPLVTLLHRLLDLPRLDRVIADGIVHALAVTASSYTAGHHITFYQTAVDVPPWRRTQRLSVPDQIGIEHLLASSAIPLIFPAIPLFCEGRREYCGDGSMRQLAPIAPAIHLGAEKVFIIGAGRLMEPPSGNTEKASYPTVAQIAGHAMSSIFLDSLAVDIERMNRINCIASALTEEQREATSLRHIEMLVIAPSQRLDEIAGRHVHSLPGPVKTLLAGSGATEVGGSALASYLLFSSAYTRELIQLGQVDTLARRSDILRFFGADASQDHKDAVSRAA